MSSLAYVTDFTSREIPHGGSEQVDDYISRALDAPIARCKDIRSFDKSKFHIFSNISTLAPDLVSRIPELDYIVIEHDYKFHATRHPWRFPNSLVPRNELINLDLYRNARAVFTQTDDHRNVFERNGIQGNFVSLKSSIWSPADLALLAALGTTGKKTYKYVIYDSANWIKNTAKAVSFCRDNNLDFELLGNQPDRETFLGKMAGYSTLVFFPVARETMCRLVVEARCLNMNVITTKNYGATLSSWFSLAGRELVGYLASQSTENLATIRKHL